MSVRAASSVLAALLLLACPAAALRAAAPPASERDKWHHRGERAFFGVEGEIDTASAARCFGKATRR